jgi:hypothetical protein
LRDNSHYLVAAQRQHRTELIEKVTIAIRALDRQGEPVSFASVVRASGVSRSFLNKIPELAAEIRSLRDAQSRNPRPQPSGQRMSDASKDARISQLSEGNRKLREEVAWLKDQNAALLGKLRLA